MVTSQQQGQDLEKHVAELMSSLLEDSIKYWPSRAGKQNGYDAYAIVKFLDEDGVADYFWKFECKDLSGKSHRENYDNVEEVELSDFSDKILEILSSDKACYPDVFCLVIPHRVVGKNNILRDQIATLNNGKLPFKVIVWDFNFLKDKVPGLNIEAARSIYPNAPPQVEQSLSLIQEQIKAEMKKESREGKWRNSSYMEDKELIMHLTKSTYLFIGIRKCPLQNDQVIFQINGEQFYFSSDDLSKCAVRDLSVARKTPLEASSLANQQESEVGVSGLPEEIYGFDERTHMENISKGKHALLSQFKAVKSQLNRSFFLVLQDFCLNSVGLIYFIYSEKDELLKLILAHLPFKELSAIDFESSGDIRFQFRCEV